MPTDAPAPRAKRRDAARNNDRLVQAAREVFARQGLSATLEDIARHAGVGVGTVYRNFASKREIIDSLYGAVLESVLADVRAALEIDDPWVGLATFFEVTAANQARDRGLCETFLGRDGVSDADAAVAAELIPALSRLFSRASAAGVLRAGVSYTDAWPIFAMLYTLYGVSEEHPELWRRYLAVLLDGLRADGGGADADGGAAGTGVRGALPVPPLDAARFAASLNAPR
jgi:AcrR family transcriptional regulator